MIPANPRRSGGPRTAAGKQAASHNALKTGMYAQQIVLPGEEASQWELLLEHLNEEYQPVGVMEASLVRDLAACLWRKLRYERLETAHFLHTVFYREIEFFEMNSAKLESDFAPTRSRMEARRGVIDERFYKFLLSHNTQRPLEDINRVLFKTLAELRKQQDWRLEREAREMKEAAAADPQPVPPGPEDVQAA